MTTIAYDEVDYEVAVDGEYVEQREETSMSIPWGDVRERLGITPERAADARRETDAYVAGYRLAELRKKAGITQVELAKRLGVGQPRVSAMERGELDTMTLASIRAYVEALGGQIHVIAQLGDTGITLKLPESA